MIWIENVEEPKVKINVETEDELLCRAMIYTVTWLSAGGKVDTNFVFWIVRRGETLEDAMTIYEMAKSSCANEACLRKIRKEVENPIFK